MERSAGQRFRLRIGAPSCSNRRVIACRGRISGVGIVTVARILARTGDPARFANEAAFANYSGTAPIEVASADNQRHRLSRSGDRTLNSAIHIVAVTQARTPSSDGYAYHQRKMAECKTSREAMRCLKRQVAKRLWRTMRNDVERRTAEVLVPA